MISNVCVRAMNWIESFSFHFSATGKINNENAERLSNLSHRSIPRL